MEYPSIYERLKIISDMIERREDLHQYLDLQRKILQTQLEADIKAKTDWIEKLPLSSLEQKALESKKPITHFLDPMIFDIDLFKNIFRKVGNIIASQRPDTKGLKKLLDHMDTERIDFVELIASNLKEDEKPILSCAEQFKMDPSLLLFLISTPIQPFIEQITRRVTSSFFEKWWRAHCPVCGRMPNVARIHNKLRYLLCGFCGAEYLSDYFLCVNCGNKDPYTLKYMKIEGKPEFQIDFCTKCKNYIKVIIERAVKEPILRSTEDLLTLDLDIEAKNAGLMRPG